MAELTDRHRVGVPEIDRQHEHLVLLCNQLNEALKAGEPEDGIRRRFDEMVLYTRFHFATEERLMAAHGYAELEVHRSSHERLLSDLERCSERLKLGGELVALQAIKDWLFGHIDSDDAAMGRHLVSGGR